MKKYLLPLLLLPAVAWGQASFGHLDSIELAGMRADRQKVAAKDAADADAPISFFMRVADDDAVKRVEAAGATITQREGNILVVSAPLARAEAIAATEGVITVSLPREVYLHEWTSPYGPDLSRQVLGLDRIQAGAEPLKQAYTGKGVIVGIIDQGVDVHHISLLNPDGTHRVKRAWKHVVSGKSKLTITADTEAKVAKFSTDNSAATHGTHVMGIAAGSFKAPDGPDFTGAAPEADIAVSCGYADTEHLLKGLRSIVDYAKSEGRPCVVNISLGNNSGPHDGTDEFPAALNAIAGEEGVTVCVSSGNEGAEKAFLYHEYNAEAEPLRAIINPSEYTASMWPGLSFFPQALGAMEIWGDDDTPFTVYLDLLKFSASGIEVVTTFTIPAGGSGYICTPGMAPAKADVVNENDEMFNKAYRQSFIGGATSLYAANNRYRAEVSMQLECGDAEEFQSYRMAMRVENEPGHKVYVYGAPKNGLFPFMFLDGVPGYADSNADGSINALAGADNVISVGSYVTHNMSVADETIGTTAYYTSWGHTPDGRIHPLVSAPGSRIVSAMSSVYASGASYDPNQIKYYSYEAPNGKTYHWTPMSGTSMSSPYMTGIAAMWLSADPTLTTADIVRVAQETADTPAEPRYNDGMGAHVNAFAGLCKILGLSGVSDVVADGAPYSLLRSGDTFTVQAPGARSVSVKVFSMQGTLVASAEGGAETSVDCSALAPGVYVLAVETAAGTGSEKITIF